MKKASMPAGATGKPAREKVLFIDFETASPVDIKTAGAWLYAAAAHVLLISYRFSTDPAQRVKTVKNFDRKTLTAADIPADLKTWRGPVVAHNWSFEHAIFTHCLPFLSHFADPSVYICTAATARRYGLPGSLDDAARALKLKHQKEKADGSRLINKYSKPDKNGEFRPISKEDRAKWVTYGVADVLTMQELFETMPRLDKDPFEGPVFRLDQKFNLEGLRVDRKSVTAIRKAYDNIIETAERRALSLCGVEESGTLTVCSAQGFARWLGAAGCPVDNVQAGTLDELLSTTKNAKVVEAIKLRQTLAAAGPKKLESLLSFSDDAGIMRHGFFYFGGHTGRWSGRGAQPQNFIRDVADDWAETFAALKRGEGGVDEVNSLLRGCLIPRKGHKLAVGDFSAIEARGLFYLAGCASGLQVFKDGRDIYKEQAARFYAQRADAVTEAERQIGKAQILGLGYGMGAKRFVDYARTYGVELTLAEAEAVVRFYRLGFPEVPRLWRDTEAAFRTALRDGVATVGDGARKIIFRRSADKKFLRVTLPSGRNMFYFRPRITEDGELVVNLPRGGIQKLWGGVIVENIVQAYCRDLMASAMLAADAAGLLILGTVHDEIIGETKTRKGLMILEKAMTTAPDWAPGFPLAAECALMDRYGK